LQRRGEAAAMSDEFPAPHMAIEFLTKKVRAPTGRRDDLKWGNAHGALLRSGCAE
jgi:hypothetical protein